MSKELAIESKIKEAKGKLDNHVRGIVQWHFDPETGSPFWLEFAKKLLAGARVAVSPGIGFGEYGDDHVRFALIENEARNRQAIRGIKDMFRKDGLISQAAA